MGSAELSGEMPGLRDPELKKEISKAFKLHGYQLRIEASRHLEELLAPVTLRSPWLEKILDLLAKKDLETNVVDKATIDKVIKECSNEVAGDATENVFNVIDAFTVPRLTYSVDRKKFLPDTKPASIFADADSKANITRLRYLMLQQRTARHKLFSNMPASTTEDEATQAKAKQYSLKTVDFLLGTNTKVENVIVLGMLTILKHGRY